MNKYGYTLLEVTLFMAITGMLTLVAFVGLGPRLTNVRFTDAVRSLESSSTRRLQDFQSGVNTRELSRSCNSGSSPVRVTFPSSGASTVVPGTAANCVINGKLAVFRNDTVDYYPIVSLRTQPASPACSTPPAGVVCFGPTIIDSSAAGVSKETVAYKNGTINTATTSAYGHIQDPNGTQIYPFVIPAASVAAITHGAALSNLNVSFNTGTEACVTLALGGRQARITYKNSTLLPETVFNAGCSG